MGNPVKELNSQSNMYHHKDSQNKQLEFPKNIKNCKKLQMKHTHGNAKIVALIITFIGS